MSKDHIFVCYSSKDRKYADSLVAQATQLNKNKLWVSHIDSIEVGENYRNYIQEKIENSSGAILLVSKSFLDSDFINNVELPLIFEQKKKSKNFKIVITLIENCNFQNNSYLASKHMINSKSTALKEISSRQYDLIIKEILEEFPNSLIKKTKLNTKYLLPISSIFLLIYFGTGFFNSTNENEGIDTEFTSTPTTSIAVSEEEVNNIINEPDCIISTLNKSYIEGEEGKWTINEFWNNQSYWGPQSIDEKLTNLVPKSSYEVLPCENIHEAEILYQDSIPFIPTGDDGTLNFEELSEVRQNNYKKCYANFEKKHDFGFKTEFEIKIIFLKSDSINSIDLFCLVVKKETGTGKWLKWAFPLSDFNFTQYSSSNFIQSKTIRDLEIGDCLLYPDWWISSKNPFNPEQDILDRSISKIPCYNPHDYEVVSKFSISVDDERTDLEKEYYASDICQNSALFHEDFDIPANEQELDYWFLTDLYVNNKIENTFFCLAGPFGEYDSYKSNYSLRERLEKKIYQANLGIPEEIFFKIDNCPVEIKENEYYEWIVSWGNLNQPFNFLQLIFSDAEEETIIYIASEHNEVFKELTSWSTKFFVSFSTTNDISVNQTGQVFALLSFGTDQLITTCNNISIVESE